jgi:molybdenum cofactor synthesis domain-containing protein
MPADADTVFMQEDVRTEGDAVIVPAGLKLGANRRLAGEDIRKGSLLLPAGRRLAAQDVALAAAVGLTELNVRRRVRVALFSTGDEIVEPGKPRPAAALYDANRVLLDGMLERLGAEVTDLGILKDDPSALETAIAKAARDHDLVLTSGGVSTGEADSRPAKRTTCATRSRRSASWCSGASRSSQAGRWPWAWCRADVRARQRSSACRAIRWRPSSPLRAWCGPCSCASLAPTPSR